MPQSPTVLAAPATFACAVLTALAVQTKAQIHQVIFKQVATFVSFARFLSVLCEPSFAEEVHKGHNGIHKEPQSRIQQQSLTNNKIIIKCNQIQSIMN